MLSLPLDRVKIKVFRLLNVKVIRSELANEVENYPEEKCAGPGPGVQAWPWRPQRPTGARGTLVMLSSHFMSFWFQIKEEKGPLRKQRTGRGEIKLPSRKAKGCLPGDDG